MTLEPTPGAGPPRPDQEPRTVSLTGYRSREREVDRRTRKPLPPWDRIKWILALCVLFVAFVWSLMATIPIIPFSDALSQTLRSKWWLLALAGVEVIRQIH